MSGSRLRSSVHVVLVIAVAVICPPTGAQAQEMEDTTVTGRLHSEVEVRVRLDSPGFGERWFVGGTGHISLPVGAGNLVACTAVTVPELSEEEGTLMVPLGGVAVLQVRHRSEEEWRSLDLAPLLEAEPKECESI